jgi:hypothetical protein
MYMRQLIFAAMLITATSASASDEATCAKGMVCASSPQSIADAVREAGYKAKVDKDGEGDPKISSAANGFTYDIYFYGCDKGKNCDAIQFITSFEKDSANTPALANKWNDVRRFSHASIDKDGSFVLRYDLTTIGGMNAKNFEDALDWWHSGLGQLAAFFKENPADPKK